MPERLYRVSMTRRTDDTLRNDVIASAEGLAELLARESRSAEEARSLTPTVTDAAERSAIFATVSPTSHGGLGLGLETLGDATRIMAHGCCASAWTVSFLMLHNWFITRFPNETQDELWAERPFVHVAAPLAPTGTAERTVNGWRIDGRWEWATGVNHSDWVMVHALDAHTPPPHGSPFSTRFALVPVSSVTIEDVWFTAGMCATGSNSVLVDGVEVPDHHTVAGNAMLEPGSGGDLLDPLPLMAVLALVAAAPALGAAEAVVESFENRMRERVLAYTLGDRQSDQPASRVRLASALAEVRAARALWSSTITALTGAAWSDRGATQADRADARLAAASVVKMSRSAISTVAEGSGASVYAQGSPLQRFQRDVEVLKGHVVFDWDRSAELAGRVLLGMELGPTDLL
jgi:alkylation response protein AidB-like acyl-CoA dehydrogenase